MPPQQQGMRGQQQRTGQGGHRGKGPKNFQRTDERIREAVSEALEIHDDLDATHIEVLVKNAEVVLSGSVDSRDAKRLAEDIAASVSGVRDVQNQIKVGGDRDRTTSSSTQRSEHAMPETTTDSRKARA
jgi:osmotically-inducible protein OsmY